MDEEFRGQSMDRVCRPSGVWMTIQQVADGWARVQENRSLRRRDCWGVHAHIGAICEKRSGVPHFRAKVAKSGGGGDT